MVQYLAMEIPSILKSLIMIYIMTVAMVMTSQLAVKSSNFIKWKEHTEYSFPVTSLEFHKASSTMDCATVCSIRNEVKDCTGFAYVFINNQETCALAIKVRGQLFNYWGGGLDKLFISLHVCNIVFSSHSVSSQMFISLS